MQYVYIVVIGLHVMAGVFWAGTTIAVARDPDILQGVRQEFYTRDEI